MKNKNYSRTKPNVTCVLKMFKRISEYANMLEGGSPFSRPIIINRVASFR